MGSPGSSVFTLPAAISAPPAGGVGHLRATVGLAENLLSAWLPGGKIPSGTLGERPIAVNLQVEQVDGNNLTYVTCDGTSTAASATNGIQVPVAPNLPLRLAFPAGLLSDAGTIRAVATVADAHVQCFFEW